MKKIESVIILVSMIVAALSMELSAQNWEFIKEKDGIKIYTRKDGSNTLKSFRGIMDVHSDWGKVTNLIGNVKNVDWWDKNLREIKVMTYEKDKFMQYYLVYDAPWPVTDRDLCVEATVSVDPATGIRTIYAVPLSNVIPENPEYVRIKNYWQKWMIQDMKNGTIHLVLEGHVDPGGSVPDWIYNMVITDTPLKIMRGIKERVEKRDMSKK
jgi:hypothetical protein